VIVRQLDWESLDSWITPNDQFFIIKHYDEPTIDVSTWALQISGDVANPMSLTLDDLKARERTEVTFTLECSGNTGLPFFDGGIGNAPAGLGHGPINLSGVQSNRKKEDDCHAAKKKDFRLRTL